MIIKRDQSWICSKCYNIINGTVSINIPSKHLGRADGMYNCLDLYCDNCNEITSHFDVDRKISPLLQVLNKNNYGTEYSCQGHVYFNGDYRNKKFNTDAEYLEFLFSNLDIYRPYVIISNHQRVLDNMNFCRKVTEKMMSIFEYNGWTELRFTYKKDGIKCKINKSNIRRTTEEYDGDIFYLDNEPKKSLINRLINSNLDSIKISYTGRGVTRMIDNLVVSMPFTYTEKDVSYIRKIITTTFTKSINKITKELEDFYSIEPDVEIKKLDFKKYLDSIIDDDSIDS